MKNIVVLLSLFIFGILSADLILEEGFESGDLPPGWTQEYISSNTDWDYTNGGYSSNPPSAHSGSYNARFYYGSSTPHITRLITPALNLGVSSNGELSFWHAQKIWLSDQDELKIYYRNSESGNWNLIVHYQDNTPDWTQRTVSLPDPSETYYVAFEGIAKFGYGVCVDDVLITGQPVQYENDLAAISLIGPNNVNAGNSYIYDFTVRNSGLAEQDSYTVRLLKDSYLELSSLVINQSIQPGEERQHQFVWNIPQSEPLGQAYLQGDVILDGDDNGNNDQTSQLNIMIMPYGQINIGNGSDLTYYMPLNFYYMNSLSETIYYFDEFNTGGLINGIAWYNNFSSNLSNMPTRVWIGETTQTSLCSGWIPSNQLVPVFDDNINYPSGENMIMINFNEPFIYTGNNLAILVQRPMDTQYYSNSDKFYSTNSSPHPDRSRYAYADFDELDPETPPMGTLTSSFPNTAFFLIPGGLGNVQGYVRDEDDQPLAGAQIIREGSGDQTFSNTQGYYYMGNIPEGNYDFTASLFGYSPQTLNTEITENDTIDLDFSLLPLGMVSVSGRVTGSDFPDDGLSGIPVYLSGFEDYQTLTDADGYFLIEGVYTNITYRLDINCEGYDPYSESVFVSGEDLDLGTIILYEIADPPGNVQAFQNDPGTEVDLYWNSPGSGGGEFRYDDGEFDFQFGSASLPTNAVFGSVHRHIAVIQEISWFLTAESASHSSVKLYVFGLDSYGDPDSSELLFISGMIPNIDDQWNYYTLPQAVTAENGFLVGLGTPGIWTGLGMDDGVGDPWVFTPGTQWITLNYTQNPWQDLAGINPPQWNRNFMIRAYGIDLGEIAFNFTETSEYDQIA
ncbi:MAG: carboxypeptidase regulatory-like domain-containing protein, partial [Candidatus Cloacimonetes bacterium]|nr:carboxypeptidase regulatory-like domain-containing protein [Candidatus Cloacimonadota bacterium]